MPTLVIGGKPYDPPPLKQEVNVSSRDGRFRARLGAGLPEDEGIWLCDQQTGFRVASCVKLGRSVLPDPLWFPELTGDIFAPNLLRHQDTARSTLARDFLRRTNKEWRNFQMFLIRDVVPFAQQLIERDSIRGNAAETLDEIAQMFHDRFGLPEDRNTTKKSTRNEKIVHQEDPAEPREKKGRGQGNGEVKDAERYRRYISIKVRDEVYHLYRGQSLHPYIFAQVNPDNPHIVYVNVRGGYKALPEQKTARREHCFLQILMAIGKNKYPSDAMQAMLYANEIRGDFLKN